jgi:hypothetical protein
LSCFKSAPAPRSRTIGINYSVHIEASMGSGIHKTLVIGFGKQVGANNAHRAASGGN